MPWCGCRFWCRPKANQLWTIWYCALVVLVNVYLLYVARLKYKAYEDHPALKRKPLNNFYDDDAITSYEDHASQHRHYRLTRDPPPTEPYLTAYVFMHVSVLVALCFFVIFSTVKVGNLANDGEKLGERTQTVVAVSGSFLCRKIRSVWVHGPPTAVTLHLFMAYTILLANILMEGQLFKYKVYFKEHDVWSTELDFIFNRHQKTFHNFFDQKTATNDPSSSSSSSFFPPPPNHSQPNADSSTNNKFSPSGYSKPDTVLYSGERYFSAAQKLIAVSLWPEHYGLSLDFLNYLLALTLFAAVYPSTFWRANKPFGAIFSLHSLILAFSSIFSYLSLKIMYRLRNSQHFEESSSLLTSSDANFNNNRYSAAAAAGATTPPVFILDDKFLLALNVATTVILYASTTVVYGYGYNKFCIGLWLRNSRSRMRGQKTYKICCEGYSPHIAAIFMLILMVACKSPLLYDQMLLYQQVVKPIILVCIISDVAYLFFWIILWLILTLVRDWKFRTRHTAGELCRMEGLQRPPDAGDHRRRRFYSGDSTTSSSDGPTAASSSGVRRPRALFLTCGDEIYATDDEAKKQALMRLVEKCAMGQRGEDDVYWLKPTNNRTTSNELLSGGGGACSSTLTAGRRPNGQQMKPSQESSHLLTNADHQMQQQQQQSPQTPVYKKPIYYKAAFDDMEQGVHSPKAVVRYPTHRGVVSGGQQGGGTVSSGSYIRFNADDNIYEHAPEIIDVSNTFGTLRKTSEFKQRSSMPSTSNEEPTYVAASHVGGNDFYGNLNYKPLTASRNNETLPYASIHKQRGGSPNRNVRPFPAQVHTLPLNAALDDAAVAAGTVSRGSSYVNVSATGRNAPWADVGSLGRPAVNGKPPSGQATTTAVAATVGQTQRFVGQGERQPSYSSIQSQQLAAAYASTCSPIMSQYRKGSINAYQVEMNAPICGLFKQPPSSSHHHHQQQHHSPSVEKSPTSNNSSTGADGYASKLSSFSDVPDTVIRHQNYGKTHDSTVTLVESPTTVKNEHCNSGNVASRAPKIISQQVGWKAATVNLQQKNGRNYGVGGQIYSSGVNNRQNPASSTPAAGNLEAASSSSSTIGTTVKMAHIRKSSNNNNNGLPGGGNVMKYDDRDKNDSANFSLTSSNESDNNQQQYVTSIV